MQIETTRFGTVEIEEGALIHFPLGLLGFENFQRYFIIDSDDAAPLRWLQSADQPNLAFLVVEPDLFFPDYNFKLPREDREFLKITKDEDMVIACVVVVPPDPTEMTINLMGPLVINSETRLAKQVVLHESGYSTRERLLPAAPRAEEPAMGA